jgi:hypothetical protein
MFSILIVSTKTKLKKELQSNSVITNSMGPSIFARYNRDIVITVKLYVVN